MYGVFLPLPHRRFVGMGKYVIVPKCFCVVVGFTPCIFCFFAPFSSFYWKVPILYEFRTPRIITPITSNVWTHRVGIWPISVGNRKKIGAPRLFTFLAFHDRFSVGLFPVFFLFVSRVFTRFRRLGSSAIDRSIFRVIPLGFKTTNWGVRIRRMISF